MVLGGYRALGIGYRVIWGSSLRPLVGFRLGWASLMQAPAFTEQSEQLLGRQDLEKPLNPKP